jgi:hypothetical protein
MLRGLSSSFAIISCRFYFYTINGYVTRIFYNYCINPKKVFATRAIFLLFAYSIKQFYPKNAYSIKQFRLKSAYFIKQNPAQKMQQKRACFRQRKACSFAKRQAQPSLLYKPDGVPARTIAVVPFRSTGIDVEGPTRLVGSLKKHIDIIRELLKLYSLLHGKVMVRSN